VASSPGAPPAAAPAPAGRDTPVGRRCDNPAGAAMVVVAMVPPGGRSRSGRYMYARSSSEANCPASQFREISLSRIHAMIPAAATRNRSAAADYCDVSTNVAIVAI
jgi:hypothetical protein